MLKQYYGIDGKHLIFFVLCILVSAGASTFLYWVIFGFDTWQSEMTTAQDVMLAAAVQPNAGQANQQTLKSGLKGTTPGQYLCPRDGAVGLPVYNANGSAHCPVCNTTMVFHGAVKTGAQPVATVCPPGSNGMALAAGG